MTKIQWTEETWNPIAGCSVVSPGCKNCYAMRRVAPRLAANPATPQYHGTVVKTKAGYTWTGKIGIAGDAKFLEPLRVKKPATWFVNSTSDLFHENVPDAVIDRVFAVMALCASLPPSRQSRSTPLAGHTFQVLTKRSARMRQYMEQQSVDPGNDGSRCVAPPPQRPGARDRIIMEMLHIAKQCSIPVADLPAFKWPLPNVWLGVSVEDQRRADERIPDLLATPAAIRFISAEPLLGPVDLKRRLSISWQCSSCRGYFSGEHQNTCPACGSVGGWCGSHAFNGRGRPTDTIFPSQSGRGLDWVIVGGESGKGARPMHPDWARDLRDQCAAAGVPFFFKQWGDWKIALDRDYDDHDFRLDYSNDYVDHGKSRWLNLEGGRGFHGERFHVMHRVGTKRAGRLLDGVEHNEMPEVRHG